GFHGTDPEPLPSVFFSFRDFSTEFLTCDCHLSWVAALTKNGSIQISDRTFCSYPSALRDRPLRNLKESQLTCGLLEAPLKVGTGTAKAWKGCRCQKALNCGFDLASAGVRWPRTLAGITAYQPCLQYPFTTISNNGIGQKASRRCDRSGHWEEGDYSNCLYTNDLTRILYTFVLMPVNASNVLTLAQQLRMYTAEAGSFSDMMDVIYVAKMIEKFVDSVDQVKDLADVMLEMASNMMLVDDHILWMAQVEDKACSRMVQALEKIANLTVSSSSQDLSVNSLALGSVQLPQSLFASSSSPACKLQVLAFRNGKLFRSVGNSSRLAEDGKRRSISTPVIFVGTGGCEMGNLTDAVIVTLRHLVNGSDPLPAHWNFRALEGYGGWSSEGCQLLAEETNITSMQCLQLNNFAILTELNTFSQSTQNGTELLHPVIYTCTAVLLICLFATIITYIVNHSSIQISRKGWHMLLNLCFHIAMTSAVFAGGITLSGYVIVCQAVSVILHYSSLSTLLWMVLKARVIYRELTHKPQPQQEGEAVQTPNRPMLSFYLIAGGIPLIICGITAAVNINNYRDNSPYCCLVWRPSLAAFYVPAAIILLITWIYFLCAGINLKRQPVEQKDLGEANDVQQSQSGISHLLSDSTSISVTINSAAPPDVDTVYSLEVQFWSLVIVHVLYVILWIFGAFAVSQIWYLNIIFSCLYGVTAVALGLFIFIHHCIRRQDVQRSCCPMYTETTPIQAYVQTSSPVDDTPPVFIGCNPDGTHSVKSSSSPSNSSNSNTGPCKITNLQVAQNQAENCPPKPASCEDSEPANNKCVTAQSRYTNNLHNRRNHKSRTKQYREGKHHRLKVLRGPSSDLPSSESGSVHNSHSESYHSKSSPLNNGRTEVAARDPEGALTHSEGSDSSGHQAQDFARAQRKSASRDNLKQANSMERESKRRSFPLNTGNQNGVLKGSKYDINLATTESPTAMKTGLWKSETTV
ncbi:hypothetical protein AB205_0070880, partial [Aquarana catesbeiana]